MNFSFLRVLMIGNALEYYDFFLYSFFVSILSPLFFPSSDSLSALMMGFSVFALGFIARPLGALIFGHWGDKQGRKKVLSGTLLLMAFSTLGIGLLPGYGLIGFWAPLLLVFFRFLQGLAAGGEVNGAAILGLEQTSPTQQGLAGALITSSAGIGAIFATLAGAICMSQSMPSWGWRIPFCLGGLVAFVGIYLRQKSIIHETPSSTRVPLIEVMQNHPFAFLKAIGVGGFMHVPFYIIVGYMNPILHVQSRINSVELMLMNGAVTFIGVIVIPLMGYVSDKVGPCRLMSWGALGQIALALPVFFLYKEAHLVAILFTQMALLFCAEAFIAPSNAYLNGLFPSHCRYSGVAFGACLGTAIFGGTTPLVCSQLAKLIGPCWGPSLYLMGTAFMGLMAVRNKSSSTLFSRSPASA